jgi:hypothetical protein
MLADQGVHAGGHQLRVRGGLGPSLLERQVPRLDEGIESLPVPPRRLERLGVDPLRVISAGRHFKTRASEIGVVPIQRRSGSTEARIV